MIKWVDVCKVEKMLDLNAMVMFARVVRHGSFSEAARRSGVSTSTLSRRVAQLEDALEARLLERDSRNVRLTAVGEAFLERCQRIALEADLAADAVDALQVEPRGPLRVAASPLFCQAVLADMLPDFLARYPAVELDLRASVRRVAVLEEGFDVAIRAGKPEVSDLIGRRLGEAQQTLVAAPAWLDGVDPIDHPTDLAGRGCLVYSPRSGPVRWRFTRGEEGVVVEVGGARIDDLRTACRLAVAGAGPTVVPALLAKPGLRDGRLVRLLPAWSLPSNTVMALYPSRRYVAPAVRAFLDGLVAHIELNPWRID